MGDRYPGVSEQPPLTSDDASLLTVPPVVQSPPGRLGRVEVVVALVAFAALCVAVLARSAQLLEPDDYAYRASTIALTQGHMLSLTNAEYQALLQQLSGGGGMGIHRSVGAHGRRHLDRREEPRLPIPCRPVPDARTAAGGPVVLRGAGLPGPVRRRSP